MVTIRLLEAAVGSETNAGIVWAERTDQALHIRRLPGRTRRNVEFFKPQSLDHVLEVQTINAVPVPQEVFGW